MSITPPPVDEDYRLAALRSLGVLFTPPEERYDRITRLAARLLQTPIAYISLLDEDVEWFKSSVAFDLESIPRADSLAAHAIQSDDPLVLTNAASDPRFANNPFVTSNVHVGFYAAQPLRLSDGSRVGTIAVIDHVPRNFEPEQMAGLRDLGALVEAEFDRGLLHQIRAELQAAYEHEIQNKAGLDPVTHLWNRSAMLSIFERELARAQRGAPMGAVQIELDNFAAVLENAGAHGGDEVAIEIAARLRSALRDFDVIGRCSDDTFLIILANCGPQDARVVAERLRTAIDGRAFASLAGDFEVTASLGLNPSLQATDGVAAIVAGLERAVADARAGGRNRVATVA